MQIRQMVKFFLIIEAYNYCCNIVYYKVKYKSNRPLFQVYTCQNFYVLNDYALKINN